MTRRRSRSTRDKAKSQTTFNHEFDADLVRGKTYAEYSDFYSFSSDPVTETYGTVAGYDPTGDVEYWAEYNQEEELIGIFKKQK